NRIDVIDLASRRVKGTLPSGADPEFFVAHPDGRRLFIANENDNMVSVNSSLQVDFAGQAASESIGYKQFSGSGGQADFIRGASWSRGGRSILAFHSTAAGGRISRIVPHLDEGSIVTTTRTDIHYIVTEYGIADLRGKSMPQRAQALIAIAHPDFRDELRAEFRRIYNRDL
ncbi:MAG TPA: acetyl-CoA hydrolase/transferase C-terminal domain-containing protein, partial [Deltaproteobacteria bacterium]|nr:acetyl-CoA hydrolase/transferase C-terminal domain-containing protein [Deltaproteobacteria bacterium]